MLMVERIVDPLLEAVEIAVVTDESVLVEQGHGGSGGEHAAAGDPGARGGALGQVGKGSSGRHRPGHAWIVAWPGRCAGF
jgi:hypothetical protein